MPCLWEEPPPVQTAADGSWWAGDGQEGELGSGGQGDLGERGNGTSL